jgi:hypothetical protein
MLGRHAEVMAEVTEAFETYQVRRGARRPACRMLSAGPAAGRHPRPAPDQKPQPKPSLQNASSPRAHPDPTHPTPAP